MGDPLISLEAGGIAPVLRYDIPEPTSYEGKNLIELSFDDNDIFLPVALEMTSAKAFAELQKLPHDEIRAKIAAYVRTGATENDAVRSIPLGGSGARVSAASLGPATISAVSAPASVIAAAPADSGTQPPPPDDDDKIDALLTDVLNGQRLVATRLVDGSDKVEPQPNPDPEKPNPRLYLIESVRLSSFLGDYGAGRIVKTFSLLPGEKTKISVRTFLSKESTRTQASSVLDSVTQESATDLEESVESEQSDQSKLETTREYYADVKGSASWGWGSASASAGVKGSTNAAREESVRNIAKATEKHSMKASAKREVQINTSYEETTKAGEETAIERVIENINLSRTLNFVFRQMNQQFVTLLHLTDVRIGFFNGDRSSRREVPIYRLDDLLNEIVQPAKHTQVRQVILDQLNDIRDADGNFVDVLEEVSVAPNDSYLKFSSKLSATVTDDSDREFTVQGVLLHRADLVMRTEGVIVEALLGNGDALDDYAAEMQRIEADKRRAEIAALQAKAARLALVNDAIASGDDAAVDRAERLARECCDEEHENG
jgi:hypothetical protein